MIGMYRGRVFARDVCSMAMHGQQQRWLTLGELANAFSRLGASAALSVAEPSIASQPPRGQVDAEGIFVGPLPDKQLDKIEPDGCVQGAAHDVDSTHKTPVGKQRIPRRCSGKLPLSPTTRVLGLSLAHARYLHQLTEVELTGEMTQAYRRLDYTSMAQGLIEVWRRLDRLTAEASRAIGVSSPHSSTIRDESQDKQYSTSTQLIPHIELVATSNFPTDCVLEIVLRCLSKMDLVELEPEICSWIRSHAQELGLRHHTYTPPSLPQNRFNTTNTFEAASETNCRRSWPWKTTYHKGNSLRHVDYWSSAFKRLPIPPVGGLFEDGRVSATMTKGGPDSAPLPERSAHFLFTLSGHLLEWLHTRVPHLDADSSVTVLHLLAQQRLLFSQALVETLVDNILLGIPKLCMNQLSILIDTIHRYQASLFCMKRWHPISTPGSVHSEIHPTCRSTRRTPACAREPTSGFVMSSLVSHSFRELFAGYPLRRTRPFSKRSEHPVVNEELYNRVVNQLIMHFTHPRKAFRDATESRRTSPGSVAFDDKDSSTCLGGWAQISPTSFFFLTRALARIRFFHPGLIPAMLPGLAVFLKRNTEPYLGIVLLLGRKENRIIDPEIVLVLLKNLITMLQRRMAREDCEGSADFATCPGLPSKEKCRVDNQNTAMVVSCDEESPGGDFFQDVSSKPSFFAQPSRLPSALPSRRAGFIDLCILPVFLESLSHLFRLSLEEPSLDRSYSNYTALKNREDALCSINTSPIKSFRKATEQNAFRTNRRQTLWSRMARFLILLYTDTHHGMPSIERLECDFPLTVVQQLLRMILATNKLMRELGQSLCISTCPEGGFEAMGHRAEPFCERSDASTKMRRGKDKVDYLSLIDSLTSHTLVVELAYVWVRQIEATFGEQPSYLLSNSLIWRGQTQSIVNQLIQDGILEVVVRRSVEGGGQTGVGMDPHNCTRVQTSEKVSVEYLMPHGVLNRHPSVARAIGREKDRKCQKLFDNDLQPGMTLRNTKIEFGKLPLPARCCERPKAPHFFEALSRALNILLAPHKANLQTEKDEEEKKERIE